MERGMHSYITINVSVKCRVWFENREGGALLAIYVGVDDRKSAPRVAHLVLKTLVSNPNQWRCIETEGLNELGNEEDTDGEPSPSPQP